MPGPLFVRDVGAGPPIVVLHGGPDFDHSYLRPELDRLAASCKLVYYDQRGRGRSAPGARPEDVTIETEVADLDALREAMGVERVAVLGHSWGGLLAAEYAVRRPARVSHLILLNTAPLSHEGISRVRASLRVRRTAEDVAALEGLRASDAYARGDLDAERDYYRVHFRIAVPPRLVDALVPRLRSTFTPETVLLARAIEERLYHETWNRESYDLLPALRALDVPALVLHGSEDLIPVDLADEIASALPRARLVVLPGVGHFAYLEAPEDVHREVAALLA